ncbi:hypothetical protein BJX62DRAFT_62932 [Aspergillus germanicus]
MSIPLSMMLSLATLTCLAVSVWSRETRPSCPFNSVSLRAAYPHPRNYHKQLLTIGNQSRTSICDRRYDVVNREDIYRPAGKHQVDIPDRYRLEIIQESDRYRMGWKVLDEWTYSVFEQVHPRPNSVTPKAPWSILASELISIFTALAPGE